MEQKSARILQSIMLMLAMTLLLVLALDIPVMADDSDNPAYLSFTGTEFFSIKVNDKEKHWDGKLEYSTDTGDTKTWTEWDGKTTISRGWSHRMIQICLR